MPRYERPNVIEVEFDRRQKEQGFDPDKVFTIVGFFVVALNILNLALYFMLQKP